MWPGFRITRRDELSIMAIIVLAVVGFCVVCTEFVSGLKYLESLVSRCG